MDATTGTRILSDVLVIEDDEIMRNLLADWLEAAGFAVRTAADCGGGLAEVERAVPALVVTDMRMPGPGGCAIICNLKRSHPALPVIAISANFGASGSGAAAAIALGAAQAFAKPVKRGDFLRAVAELAGAPART